jgi:ABC-2 type transport system permease protein
MMQWTVIFKKEMLEHARSKKWIWVPLVFFIFGIMDQLTTYYLPKILKAVGGLPEGAEINIPMPKPPQAFLLSISEIEFLGFLIIGLASMKLISGELKSGVYELILSKPVKYSNYVTAKWSAISLLVLVSLFIGLLGGWYYTNILFGKLEFTKFLNSFLIFSVYVLFFISILILVNTWFKRSGPVLFVSLILLILVGIFTSIFGHKIKWSPSLITSYVTDYLTQGSIPSDLWGAIGVTIISIIFMILLSIQILKNKEK